LRCGIKHGIMPQRWTRLWHPVFTDQLTAVIGRHAVPVPGWFLRSERAGFKIASLMMIALLGVKLASATPCSTHSKNSSAKRQSSGELKTVSAKAGHSSKFSKSKRSRVRGQQAIQGDRARQIQTALIREGYLDGEPSGAWDQKTKDAMSRYQSDHGWQTKSLPDSRALIQLGLGPSHERTANAQPLPASVQPVKSSALPSASQ
jgi:hypothetical protein